MADDVPVPSSAAAPPQIAQIDAQIRAAWSENQLTPSAPASDQEYCRRLFLDVLGRIPTMPELEQYVADKPADRKRHLVRRLLYDEAYRVDYADHWSTIWTNLLIGRGEGTDGDRGVNRPGLRAYLQDSFAQDKPYDQLVHELVTATGSNQPGAPEFNGAVNFLSGKLADGATQATAQTARLFLGLQVQCTQCHNHPFNEWKQNQFWQLNSFFRQTVALRRYAAGSRQVQFIELADQDFAGEDRPMDPEHARVYYELRNGKLEAAFPVFIDGTPIETSGFVSQVNRRRALADLMVRSPQIARAIVNRTWAQFLGYGFTQPVDDMGPHNPAVYPELLDYLAEQLRENRYDLKQLISWIVLSEPYGLSSRARSGNQRDDPALGQPPRFSHFYVRQMAAEQLYRSLLVASQADRPYDPLGQQQDARQEWLQQFTITFGTDEGDEATTFDGTIAQTLMMFNGELIQHVTAGEPGSFLYRLANDNRVKTPVKLKQLFLAALARPATAREIKLLQPLVEGQADAFRGFQDVWWSLLNSNEFILNH
jgi:hypothetical protein